MPAYLISGSAGSGKSTVCKTLAELGYTAYDTDSYPGFTRLENMSGEPAPFPEGTIDWDLYRWNWSKDMFLSKLDENDTVFFCGVSSNQSDYYAYFDKIFVLTLDDETLRHRLLTRTEKDYGKDPKQLEDEIAYRKTRESDLLAQPNAVAIDSTKPLKKVVNDILSKVQKVRT